MVNITFQTWDLETQLGPRGGEPQKQPLHSHFLNSLSLFRRGIWKRNKALVESHKSNHFTLALNEASDWTADEVDSEFLTFLTVLQLECFFV